MQHTLTYYLEMALEKAGVEVNGDMLSEIDGITEALEERIDSLTKRLDNLGIISPEEAAKRAEVSTSPYPIKPPATKAQGAFEGSDQISAMMKKADEWWLRFSAVPMRFATHMQLATAISVFNDVDGDGGKFEEAMWALKDIANSEEWITISKIVDAMSEAVTAQPKPYHTLLPEGYQRMDGLGYMDDPHEPESWWLIRHSAFLSFPIRVHKDSGYCKLQIYSSFNAQYLPIVMTMLALAEKLANFAKNKNEWAV